METPLTLTLKEKRELDEWFAIGWQATLSVLETTIELQTYDLRDLFCMN